MIKIIDVIKKYNEKSVLNKISLDIPDGKILGLVGINGVGKTTLLRMLAGIMKQDDGYIFYDSELIFNNPSKKGELFFIPDEPFYNLTAVGHEVVKLYKEMYKFDELKFTEYIKLFNLNINQSLKNYSKGMRRRFFVAIAMAINPKYLIIDEVFDGLDPKARHVLKNGFINLISDNESTIIIASHSLKELEDVCDEFAIIDEGKILHSGNIDQIAGNTYKFQLAFNENIKFNNCPFEVLDYKTVGKIVYLVVKGEKETIVNYLKGLNPLIIEELPMDFEELFISTTKGDTTIWKNISNMSLKGILF